MTNQTSHSTQDYLSERYEKIQKIGKMYEWNKEREKADREFYSKPYWVRESLEGDYLSDGSDKQEYDIKETE